MLCYISIRPILIQSFCNEKRGLTNKQKNTHFETNIGPTNNDETNF